MSVNELIREIHENATAHGWWEKARDFGEICALIHSELSEALEEYRANRPAFYVEGCLTLTDPEDWNGEKPEGIVTELADAIIRIFDYFGHEGVTLDFDPLKPSDETDDIAEYASFGEFVANCHADVTAAYDDVNGERREYLIDCISRIATYVGDEGFLRSVIAVKCEYNKTRPYKHGGKLI